MGEYQIMVELAQRNLQFHSPNGRDILDFPLHVPMGESIIGFLTKTFNSYIALLHERNFLSKEEINKTSELGNCLIKCLETYKSGRTHKAYLSFERGVKDAINMLPIKQMGECSYYRMRGSEDLTKIYEFYPLSEDQRYLCGDQRFSVHGFPCLYIGCTEEICMKEIGNNGSMITLTKKPNAPVFNLLELTFGQDQTGPHKKEKDFIMAWPLILACYIVPFYCIHRKDVCPSYKANFKEEYIIPQLLTQYVLCEKPGIDGIEYYSVKDASPKNLKDLRNIVLFIDTNDKNKYNNIIQCFEWENPRNVKVSTQKDVKT